MKIFYTLLIAATAFSLSCCSSGRTEAVVSKSRQAVEDSVFTNKFLPRGEGFTGGDGTYSIKLPDGRTLWLFGDTFIGNVTTDYRRIKTNPAYIRNSFVFIQGDTLTTLHQGKPEEFKSMMIPPEVSDGTSGLTELQLWYWPGDGFIENGNLHVFASKFFQKDHGDMWGFQFKGTELLEFSLPDLKLLNTHRFSELDSIHFGHAIYEAPDYTYIYGLKTGTPYAARAAKGSVRTAWQFYDGEKWVREASLAAPMVNEKGSEQFSVFKHEDNYILIMQDGDLGRRIYSYLSKTPYGPWGNRKMIYETPLPDNCQKCWTYNALAHPEFTKDNLLLISYNTNSMEMQDHYRNALIYRPRFVRIPLERIIGQ